MWALDVERPRAVALSKSALEAYKKANQAKTVAAEQVRTWLAETAEVVTDGGGVP